MNQVNPGGPESKSEALTPTSQGNICEISPPGHVLAP